MVSEKVGGAEGTKLDEDFRDLEKKVDVTSKAVVDIITKTSEYLQPNPASRAKLSMLNTMSKIRGQVKSPGYPQVEGLLGECMAKYGRELGEDTNFGGALVDAGESMKRMAEVKDSLDIDVKQNFIDPLQGLCDKDLREIQHHLKKLEGRRLDYDYKKKRQGKIPDEEVRQALEKFHESKEVTETSMYNLLETDIEQVSQLSSLVESQLQYHRQAVQILDELSDKLKERMSEAQSRPRREYTPKPKPVFEYSEPEQPNGGFTPTAAPPTRSAPSVDQPCCKALYDFDPENDGELGFREGDIITLTNQIDENWYEGTLHGQSGFFPLNYVEVVSLDFQHGALKFFMAATTATKRAGRPRSQLPSCYHEGYLEKRASKEKVFRRLWTSICGNALFFFNSHRDSEYVEKLELSGFVSLVDDGTRDRNLEAARFSLRMKDGEVKLTAPSLESRELWKGFIHAVVELSVPTSLNLLPGQLHLLEEVVEKEKRRRKTSCLPAAPTTPLHLPLLGEIPACFQPVSRREAEVLLERHPDCGNLLLRPGRDGASLAVTTRQDLNGSVFRHYRVSQREEGGYVINVENPIPCDTLHDEPYEENIAFVKSNDENGERSLQWAPSSPLPRAPVLPPKPGKKPQSPIKPSLPRRTASERPYNSSPGAERRTFKPLPMPPEAELQSGALSDRLKRLNVTAPPLAHNISEELKLKLEQRRANME
ncbi:hypothetical protein SKAU_G00117540 [Synaphobranchus kaupii]|uniref:Uncharacterized protein n=1 Tax=Synaphobranchus kaupii TaxID=118154 RepID=A0A9Q1FN25_SYNKA|nr:hypothetical protein SKAU_G00117540 [Synaphobranchus kaupii]